MRVWTKRKNYRIGYEMYRKKFERYSKRLEVYVPRCGILSAWYKRYIEDNGFLHIKNMKSPNEESYVAIVDLIVHIDKKRMMNEDLVVSNMMKEIKFDSVFNHRKFIETFLKAHGFKIRKSDGEITRASQNAKDDAEYYSHHSWYEAQKAFKQRVGICFKDDKIENSFAKERLEIELHKAKALLAQHGYGGASEFDDIFDDGSVEEEKAKSKSNKHIKDEKEKAHWIE